MHTSDYLDFDWDDPNELKRRLVGLCNLLDITRNLAVEIDLEKILQSVVVEVSEALNCERSSIYQYDEQKKELVTHVTNKLEVQQIRTPLGQGISGHVAKELQPLNIANPLEDPRWQPHVVDSPELRTRNVLCVPIISPHSKKLLGVLEMINRWGGPFERFDEEIAMAFSQHAAVAIDRAELVEELKHRYTIESSLMAAREIQRGFMPEEVPKIPNYEVDTWWYPNQHVGADYCDVLHLPDGRVALIVADVSGHGLGPSLLMASTRACLRALTLQKTKCAKLLEQLGSSLSKDLEDGRFITMIIGALNTNSHIFDFANAGHAPAFHYSYHDREFTNFDATGFPLGIVEEPDYESGPSIEIAKNDIVFLCTDGIVEAMDEKSEQFGKHRLEQIIKDLSTAPLEVMLDTIGKRVEDHYGGAQPPDDLTMLAIRRTDKSHDE